MRFAIPVFLGLLSVTTAQYEPVISSSWSVWSPWSFCSNNVMIRVRACSTVRGYKCIGHNKEFQSCNSAPRKNSIDYDHQDPEQVDREIAMRQLYQDYEPDSIEVSTSRNSRTRPPTFHTTNHNNFAHIEKQVESFPSSSTTSTTTTTTTTTPSTTTTSEATTTTEEADVSSMETFSLGEYVHEDSATLASILPEPVTESDFSDASREFMGDFGSDEPLPTLSVPVHEPESFPINREEDGATHSIGSYAIGSAPRMPEVPQFSMYPSSEAGTDEIPEIVETKIEMPLPVLSDAFKKTSEVPRSTAINLITGNLRPQTLPRFMNEETPKPTRITARTSQVIRADHFTSSPVTSTQVTAAPKKAKKTRRIKKINRRKPNVMSLIPTEAVKQEATLKTVEGTIAPETLFNKSNISEKDRKMIAETRELEARLLALQHKVEENRKRLSKYDDKGETTTTTTEQAPVLEGDTAKALSWMIANMTQQFGATPDEGVITIEEQIPLVPVNDERPPQEAGVKFGEYESQPRLDPKDFFPFPVDDGFSWSRTKRSPASGKVMWSEWSEWSPCSCEGHQTRKKVCIKRRLRKQTVFHPIEKNSQDIEFGEPADFPEGNRVRRSLKCPAPRIERRLCFRLC